MLDSPIFLYASNLGLMSFDWGYFHSRDNYSILPANKLCKGYVFTPVCHSVHRGDVCPSACWDTPPWDQRQIPLGTRGRHRHPRPGPGTSPPGADTPQEQTPPKEQTPLWAVHAWRYGQQAGGAHPTGMHTCYVIKLHILGLDIFN